MKMPWDNDNIPAIKYSWSDESKDDLENIAHILDEDFGGAGAGLRASHKAMVNNLNAALSISAMDAREEVIRLMKQRQYHSKSGYVGHGNMVSQVKDHVTDDKRTHLIYTDATSKDGYNYSQAFEFGLLNRNYPAQHPFRDAGNKITPQVEKIAEEAIRKGFS